MSSEDLSSGYVSGSECEIESDPEPPSSSNGVNDVDVLQELINLYSLLMYFEDIYNNNIIIDLEVRRLTIKSTKWFSFICLKPWTPEVNCFDDSHQAEDELLTDSSNSDSDLFWDFLEGLFEDTDTSEDVSSISEDSPTSSLQEEEESSTSNSIPSETSSSSGWEMKKGLLEKLQRGNPINSCKYT